MIFYQLILGSPTKQTLYNASRAGLLTAFPGLTSQLISRYYEQTAATAKGHLDLTRKNQRSTQPVSPSQSISLPTKIDDPTIYINTFTMFSDMSGNFNHPTETGDTAILLMYHDDFRYIHLALVKGKSAAAYKEAYINGLKII